MTEPISDGVRRFLASSIASVPHLEALLLLGTDPHPSQLGLLARSEQDASGKAADAGMTGRFYR